MTEKNNTITRKRFHSLLFDAKQKVGLNNTQLMAVSGVTRQIITLYENDYMYNISIKNYCALLDALKIKE